MNNAIPEFDIAIVGAGIAGSALACALRHSGMKVVLIESGRFPHCAPDCEAVLEGFDPRVSALTLGTQAFLDYIGVWQRVQALRVEPFAEMQVWDGEGTGEISFAAAEISEQQLGYLVENRVLVYALLETLGLSANTRLLDETRVELITAVQGKAHRQYELQLDKGRALRCDLLVGADGANSMVRETLGFRSREWDYDHHAIVCTIQTERHHAHTAWQRFMTTGPVALLPLASGVSHEGHAAHFCSIVWSVEPAEARRLMQLDEAGFCAALTCATEKKLGSVLAASQRFSFPLRQRHAVDYVQECVALVADAAHTIHPLAGQGINLGLQDVQVLAEELLRARAMGQRIGDVRVLSRYQRRRKPGNLLMMTVMEGFKRLFGNSSLLVKWVRNQGMLQVARHTLLKKQLIKQAMGLRQSSG